MPATGQFYLQSSEKTGNYPLLDLFVNFRIKTVRIFVRGENMLDALTPATSYFLVPNYPMPGRTLKFGIIWQFFD
jgi:outer membrane cobalamin receptor